MSIVFMIVVGLFVGWFALLLYPGKQNFTLPETALIGIAGSFTGGFLNFLLGKSDNAFSTSGLVMSVVGALVICGLWLHKQEIADKLKSVFRK